MQSFVENQTFHPDFQNRQLPNQSRQRPDPQKTARTGSDQTSGASQGDPEGGAGRKTGGSQTGGQGRLLEKNTTEMR